MTDITRETAMRDAVVAYKQFGDNFGAAVIMVHFLMFLRDDIEIASDNDIQKIFEPVRQYYRELHMENEQHEKTI